MKAWARQYGLTFIVGFIALAASLAYGMVATGALFAEQPFLVALRWFGLGVMAIGMTLWIVNRREEAGKSGLTPLFGFLTFGSAILLLLGLLFPNSGLSQPASLAGLGFALSALVIGLIATIFFPAFPQPIQTAWPGRTVLTKFAQVEDDHSHNHGPSDDLSQIEGIGPKIQEILQAAGIATFQQLASKQPEEIGAILEAAGFKAPFDPTTWPQQADMAARGEWAMLKAFQDGLKAGRTG